MKNRQMEALLTGPDGLGTQLRTARGANSMQQLADKLAAVTDDPAISKWNSSKVSKLETGKQLPTSAEIDLWASVTAVDAETRAHWQELRNEADSKRSLFRRRTPAVRATAGTSHNHLEQVAAVTQLAQISAVPDILQVEGYSRAVLTAAMPSADTEAAISELRERQKVLHDGGKEFWVILDEGVLRAIRGSRTIMAAQLDRLVTLASLEHMHLAVLPLNCPRTGPVINASFALYDGEEAVVNDGVEDHRYTGNQVATLKQAWDAAWNDAVKERAARRLIIEVADALADS